MREILFRGKQTINGDWVKGNLFIPCKPDTPTQILVGTNIYRVPYDVIPETVGQYTGLTDRNGKPIFEGDIIKSGSYEFLVSHGKCGGCANTDNYGYIGFHLEPANEETKLHMGYGLRDDIYYYTGYYAEAEVMGNIHDNPELLKGGD